MANAIYPKSKEQALQGGVNLAGAMGTRGLDLMTEWLSRKGAGK